MKLTKGGEVVELTCGGHIDAFKQAGWIEFKAAAKEAVKKPDKE